MNPRYRIAVLALLSALLPTPWLALAATPTPNTHTVTVGGRTQTYANLPGAPVSSDANTAYQFRARISYSPQCLRFADEADAVFLNGNLTDDQKIDALRTIESAAKAASCLSS